MPIKIYKVKNMKAKILPGIPHQVEGAYHDTEKTKDLGPLEICDIKYRMLKANFLAVNYWKDFGGKGSAEFKLYDSDGNFKTDRPTEGDFMRIDIPGPGDLKAKGYDWVRIISLTNEFCLEDELECLTMITQPSEKPGDRSGHIAHFYSKRSTASFRVAKGKDFVRVGIYGRNELSNISDSGFFGRIRNFFIASAGFVQLTKLQWSGLADGLINS